MYEKSSRFAGGAYSAFLKKVDRFSERTLPASLRERQDHASRLLEIDVQVKRIIAALQAKGFKSPYLRNYVVARINPVRFHKAKKGDTQPPMPLVLVDVADGHVTGVRRLIVDHARWAVVTINLDGVSDESAALRKVEDQIRPAKEQAGNRLLAIRVLLEGTDAMHHSLKADSRRFSDEVQAAAHRCGEDVWLESLRIETLDRPTVISSNYAITSLDLAATLTALQSDSDLRSSAASLIADITAKLPRGPHTNEAQLTSNLDALLIDARALVLGRATQEH